jgi:hypothetical protein
MKKRFFWDSWAGALLERAVTKLAIKISTFENYIISKRYPCDDLDATWTWSVTENKNDNTVVQAATPPKKKGRKSSRKKKETV